jgi:hypothetical protein
MPDTIKQLTRRVTTLTYTIVGQQRQLIPAIVLSRNPDGSVNMDDGKGGCVLVTPPTNARKGDRVLVDPGAIFLGSGMPTGANYAPKVPQANHIIQNTLFIDNIGNTYDDVTGVKTGTGGTPTADVDTAFGYSHSGATPQHEFVGASSSYNSLEIGIDGVSGWEGSRFSANNTVLCAGVGPSAGTYCGIEHSETGGTSVRWFINIRDAGFALLESNVADYIHSWMAAHPNTFHLNTYGSDDQFDAHISADPIDGSFWVNLVGGPSWGTPADPAPMFNVDAADGSLIKTGARQPDVCRDHARHGYGAHLDPADQYRRLGRGWGLPRNLHGADAGDAGLDLKRPSCRR